MGQSGVFQIELRLIADIGLIGKPNAGKSSLLNSLTNAHSKIGNYAFTTLEPYLGDYYGLIIADIPGLIEGASEGKGLGTKFLKHITRTNTIIHLISAEEKDFVHEYKIIRNELEMFDKELL
ncbi:MAG: 50S ribosome-binding GTPase, partial [Candidatus Pacebacteria bacterium]|nr:50S ribosome-binding GTPase [Candidatus Paceibacterota bacterium]